MPYDDSIPQNTEGDEILTLAITPKSATSKLVITFSCTGTPDNVIAADGVIALFQDATAGALAAVHLRFVRTSMIRHVMTSGTTSATTFKIRAGAPGGGNLYINSNDGVNRLMGGVSYATLTIEEYL
jgi:hypothetical protein